MSAGARKVLVTGATGFIGRHCVAALRTRGFEVHGVGRERPTTAWGGDHFHACDLMERGQVEDVIAAVRPTHLLHGAWYTAHRSYWTSDENLRWIAASLALARAFRDHGGQRLVAVGSSAEYDWRDGVCSEGAAIVWPGTIYGAAKHALHLALRGWCERAGIRLAWARLFFLFGPLEQPERLVPHAIRAFLRGEPAQFSAGTQHRDFQHARDAGGALAALVASELAGPVNIGSGRAVAVRDVVLEIARQLGATSLARFAAATESDTEPPLVVADVGRLRANVGWTDHYDLSTGLAETIDWWRRHEGHRA